MDCAWGPVAAPGAGVVSHEQGNHVGSVLPSNGQLSNSEHFYHTHLHQICHRNGVLERSKLFESLFLTLLFSMMYAILGVQFFKEGQGA